MRHAAQKLRRAAKAAAERINIKTVFALAAGALFGMAGTREFSPFGTAAVAAIWLGGGSAGAAFFGAALSALLFGRTAGFFALAAYALTVAAFSHTPRKLRQRHKLLLLPLAELLALPLTAFASTEALLCGAARLALSPAFAITFFCALRGMRGLRSGQGAAERDMLALCAAGGAACLGLSFFTLSDISGGEIFALFAALFAAGCSGIYAAVAAALCAAGAVAGGSEMTFLGAAVVFSLCAAAPRKLGRYASCAAGMAAAVLSARYLGCGAALAVEAAVCCAGYLALPAGVLRRWADAFAQERYRAKNELFGLRERMSDAAEVFARVSALLEENPESEAEQFAGQQLRCMGSAITAPLQIAAPPRYSVIYGAASLPRAQSSQTGDSISVRELEGGKLVILSDGMGSGPIAHRESAAAAALMGDLLTIGVCDDEALECVNRLLMFKGEYDMYVTMDAMRFDYASGTARFLKLGAPPSYVVKGSEVLELCAETLPVGIVEAPAPARREVYLSSGDSVVMMTDGVSDALGGDVIPSLCDALKLDTPERAANELVRRAAARSRGDDMSVVVARVRDSRALPL